MSIVETKPNLMETYCANEGCVNKGKSKPGKDGTAKIPKGWKLKGDKLICNKCYKRDYRTFAITIPVTAPDGITWEDLRPLLRDSFAEATRLKNFLIRQMFLRDIVRDGTMAKMPTWDRPYLYQETASFRIHPAMRAIAENLVQKIYAAARYEVIWTGKQSLPSFRYPQPYSTNDSKLVKLPAKEKLPEAFGVKMRLMGQKEHTTLRLSGSKSQYWRQLGVLQQVLDGEAECNEIALYQMRANEGDHRSNIPQGNKPSRPVNRLMCKLVVNAPRKTREKLEKERFFNISTTEESLLYGILQDREEPWVVNADRVRDWCYQYGRRQHRQSQDLKHEMRIPKAKKERLLRDADLWARKHNNRIKTFILQTCCQVVQFALRNDVSSIKYDDSIQNFVPRFPWFQLKGELERHCTEAGVEFLYMGKAVEEPVIAGE